MTDGERLLTIAEAAERTGLTRKAVEQRIARGTLPSVLREGRRLIPAASVQAVATLETGTQTRDELAEKYAQTRYELGVRDGEAKARRELTDGHERRERELGERIVELTAKAAAAEDALKKERSTLKKKDEELARIASDLKELKDSLTKAYSKVSRF
jgi:excisionase family DNA binding protein